MKNHRFIDTESVTHSGTPKALIEQQRIKMLSPRRWYRGAFCVNTDKKLLNISFIQKALPCTQGTVSSDVRNVEIRVHNSLCFGLYRNDRQIGFARIITDLADIAVISDVYVAPEYRYIGLGSWLVDCCLAHPATHECTTVLCCLQVPQANVDSH
ncbi:GNAT family N-acetyltransferase [Rouxiella silvae]|uniref:GNAT family N-acetyltransferase n=1 Tax=Rouxiella silvae TaxID=1646373 RepID=A0AA40X1V5_9GAMM|nr:GNAT family N-acetyltransferase [Rouxiella silvae]MBF6637028.1 GNAT family N-acetyltransferase [Rouxiella silvae]